MDYRVSYRPETIFKLVWRTDRQTDWRTDRVQTYSPLRFHRWGTNNHAPWPWPLTSKSIGRILDSCPHFRIPYLSVFPYFFHIFSMEFSWKKNTEEKFHNADIRRICGLHMDYIGKLGASLYLIRRIYGKLNLYTECQGLRLFFIWKICVALDLDFSWCGKICRALDLD